MSPCSKGDEGAGAATFLAVNRNDRSHDVFNCRSTADTVHQADPVRQQWPSRNERLVQAALATSAHCSAWRTGPWRTLWASSMKRLQLAGEAEEVEDPAGGTVCAVVASFLQLDPQHHYPTLADLTMTPSQTPERNPSGSASALASSGELPGPLRVEPASLPAPPVPSQHRSWCPLGASGGGRQIK